MITLIHNRFCWVRKPDYLEDKLLKELIKEYIARNEKLLPMDNVVYFGDDGNVLKLIVVMDGQVCEYTSQGIVYSK